jgi:hypothetical protein
VELGVEGSVGPREDAAEARRTTESAAASQWSATARGER